MSTETVTTEVTEFEDGSKIVETKTVESEYIEGDAPLVSEVVEAEAIEEVTEAAVQIAEIEAERDITIAAIQAETITEQRDSDEWRRNFEALQAENSRLTLALEEATAALTALSTPPILEEAPSQARLPASEEAVGPVLEVAPEVAPSPEAEAPAKRKGYRWI